MHLGHQKIITRLKEVAKEHDGETVLLTFYPHPRMVLFPEDNELQLLNTQKEKIELPIYSGIKGELNTDDFLELKKAVSNAVKYIKPYEGPSRKWFAYQNALDEGCSMLTEVVSHLPASRQTSKFLVKLLLRLDDKLCRGGVDDSNGTVGGFIESIVELLLVFNTVDPEIKKEFKVLAGKETCFGWEEPLLKLI